MLSIGARLFRLHDGLETVCHHDHHNNHHHKHRRRFQVLLLDVSPNRLFDATLVDNEGSQIFVLTDDIMQKAGLDDGYARTP